MLLRLYGYSGNTDYIKGETKMLSKIFSAFANASGKWDQIGNNDAGDVLNIIGGIFGALGL